MREDDSNLIFVDTHSTKKASQFNQGLKESFNYLNEWKSPIKKLKQSF